jgi:hypothetical protein
MPLLLRRYTLKRKPLGLAFSRGVVSLIVAMMNYEEEKTPRLHTSGRAIFLETAKPPQRYAAAETVGLCVCGCI